MNTSDVISILAIIISLISTGISLYFKRVNERDSIYQKLSENDLLKLIPIDLEKLHRNNCDENIENVIEGLEKQKRYILYMKYYSPKRYKTLQNIFIELEEAIYDFSASNNFRDDFKKIEELTQKLIKKLYKAKKIVLKNL